jgi:hypothetical protein
LRQLGADEEPEEVAGSCDVIGNVRSDCKLRSDVVDPINRDTKSATHKLFNVLTGNTSQPLHKFHFLVFRNPLDTSFARFTI